MKHDIFANVVPKCSVAQTSFSVSGFRIDEVQAFCFKQITWFSKCGLSNRCVQCRTRGIKPNHNVFIDILMVE